MGQERVPAGARQQAGRQGRALQLTATNGANVNAPNLTVLNNVDLAFDPTGGRLAVKQARQNQFDECLAADLREMAQPFVGDQLLKRILVLLVP
jgi:hypothetical protein